MALGMLGNYQRLPLDYNEVHCDIHSLNMSIQNLCRYKFYRSHLPKYAVT